MTDHLNIAEEFQNLGQAGFNNYLRPFSELNKGFQAITAEWTDYTKTVFEDSTKAFEKMVGAKSVEDAINVQQKYAKKAYDAHIAEMTKLGEMYANVMQTAFKP